MKLGFLLPHLGATQSGFSVIYNINATYMKRQDTDIVVFYENIIKPCYSVNFSTMNIADAWNYSGNLVSTNLSTAYKSLRFPGPSQKYFYVVDLEWVRMPNKKYEDLANIYQNKSLRLIARSKEYADYIEAAWSRPVFDIVENFDIDKFIEVVSRNKILDS